MNLPIKASPAAWTVRTRYFLAACLIALGLGSAALGLSAASAPASRRSVKSFDVAFKEFKLRNGLRVILAEDHSAPTYSICVTYNVGSRDERPGRTGFAHLFEHMLFQGSANVGKGEHFILVQNNGGSANGSTSADRTNYFEMLPVEYAGEAMAGEADRMRGPLFSAALSESLEPSLRPRQSTRTAFGSWGLSGSRTRSSRSPMLSSG